MIQGQSRLLSWMGALGFGLMFFGQAQAQNLGAYKQVSMSLEAAAQIVGKDSVKTLKHLDKASQSFEVLAPTLTNQQLVGGIRNTISGARAAQAGTPAQLQAQVTLARGLMRKALYDQTLSVLATSPNSAADRLSLLAREYGLDAGGTKALKADAKAGKLNLVSWRLQRTGMKKVGILLDRVKAEKSSGAFLNMAKATAWFSAVQDAGRLINPPAKVNQFSGAVGQVAKGDINGLKATLSTLKKNVAVLNTQLKSPPSAVVTPPVNVGNVPAQVASKAPAKVPTKAPQSAPPSSSSVPQTATAGGLGPVYASLGRALAAAGHGDMSGAQTHLGKVSAQMGSAPANIRSAAGFGPFLQEVKAAQNRAGLRVGDVQALISRLNGLEAQASGQSVSALDGLSGTVAGSLGGIVRVIVGLLLAIGAFLPLYFLNLAFGGKNPYWRAISAAILLLFLPTLLEGIFGLLAWLGGLTGVGALQSLTNLTLHQGLYGLPLSWIFNALAIALATYGFRGLCEQFGLLGSRSGSGSVAEADDSVDWDEEI